ncbi:MAG TPA: hypothetical protein VKV28_09985 [Candidatus Binataceae bacterium]|nr:hypothetical protein [Candidatus Binataceae bacterium]
MAVHGVLGLFVEDGSLALSLLAWIVVIAAAIHLGLPPRLTGAAFVLGCLLILLENVRRGADRQARAKLQRPRPKADASLG